MHNIFYLMGKSATGKDHIFRALEEDSGLGLLPLILYTTRPRRENEENGREYYFVSENCLRQLRDEEKVIEERVYHTALGDWYYFTADDGQVDLDRNHYLGIGTLESFLKLKHYYGEKVLVPLYIETEDGIRLERAIRREKKQVSPNYVELCRRFLADSSDFSEENLEKAGIRHRFSNNGELDECVDAVKSFVRTFLS